MSTLSVVVNLPTSRGGPIDYLSHLVENQTDFRAPQARGSRQLRGGDFTDTCNKFGRGLSFRDFSRFDASLTDFLLARELSLLSPAFNRVAICLFF